LKLRSIFSLLITAAATTGALPAATITWNFGSNAGAGAYGNVLTFGQGGVVVTISSWSVGSQANSTFVSAGTGQWGSGAGLGVCDQFESCASPQHTVDNSGYLDFILFQFDKPVDPTSIHVNGYETNDTDVSYWVGTTALGATRLTGYTLSGLNGLGLGSALTNTGFNSRDVSLTSNVVNTLLIGAKVGTISGSDLYDYFKIGSLSVDYTPQSAVPEPGTSLMLGGGLLALATALKRRVRG
jgi:hypothetical protein